MVQISLKVKNTIDRFLQALDRNHIPIKEAILFGSCARGNSHEWGDIDIALVSDLFVGNRIDDKDKIRRITLSISSQIEVIPFAPVDFNLENPFAKEIMKTGIRLI
ncbi:MAG: nucleotidyltransferase domain-containing protein [Candidatus Scalindua sp.]|jgi:predicted nucleotidyltransferase|nr:nucleotidyltransferase domain-containing protein [Candidatus Scalindua sp.]MBT6045277.1 nucleotidyltransferase domain-containing protein [Candidatus Scalindua sp.]MBT6231125.1 nucleotidyltransferase domain-containing protein [Candidatus Scalindua sp.]MBT6564493.1 nucleotidyltransferase domain-containing protein [Candidatus Scalindua sp.]MBT7213065.1 nucleotidyltransferase domain-containing protein [Candidatus Scalindua sp.]